MIYTCSDSHVVQTMYIMSVSELEWQKRQTKYAWAKYYELQRTHLGLDIEQVRVLRVMVEEEVPQFIRDELKVLLTELNKRVQCPVCLDDMEPSNLEISKCGHKYCQSCLETLKAQPNPMCALCRTSLGPQLPARIRPRVRVQVQIPAVTHELPRVL